MNKLPLVLIHGALGTIQELEVVASLLSQEYEVHCYEIPGHGKRSEELNRFSLSKVASDLSGFLENLGPSYIFGFSLGGYLALHLAQQSEQNILGVITLGTKLEWNPSIAENETRALNIDFLRSKVPDFYTYLTKIHGDNLLPLLNATNTFMCELGNSPSIDHYSVRNLNIPVRIILGGKDKMVSKEESIKIATAIKNGHYFEIPHFIHPIGFLNNNHLAKAIKIQLRSLQYQFLELKDKTIAYQTIEKNRKYRFIFLHEALGSIAQWKDFPEELCQKVDISGTILEMEGYGFSSAQEKERGADYLHRFALDDLPEIIKHLDYDEKLILVGHSDGGTNALLYSAHHPGKIAGIITMAAHILNEPETREGIPPAIKAYEDGKLQGLGLFHGEKTEKLFYDWANTWLSAEFKDWNITDDIENIKVPGLIIQGTNDQYGTDDQVHRISACFKGNAQSFFIENCGHAPHLEKQEEVIHAITKWLKEKIFNANN